MKVDKLIFRLTVILLFFYPFEDAVRLFSNFSVVDLLSVLTIIVIIKYKIKEYCILTQSNYGKLSLLLIFFMTMSNLLPEPFVDSFFILQLAFVFFITIPTLSIALNKENIIPTLKIYFSFFTILQATGYVLLKYLGYNILVANNGTGRFFPSFSYPNALIPGYFLIQLFLIKKQSVKEIAFNIIIIILSLMNTATLGSRSSLFGFFLSFLVVMYFGLKNSLLNWSATVTTLLIVFIAVAFNGGTLVEVFFSRDLNGTEIIDDNFRYEANQLGIESISSETRFILFGNGHENGRVLGSIFDNAQPIHNMIIQMAYEFGLVSALFFLALLAYPATILIKINRRAIQPITIISMLSSNFGSILFHPVSSQRMIWIGYGIIYAYFFLSKKTLSAQTTRNNIK